MELANPCENWNEAPPRPLSSRMILAGLLVSLALHLLVFWLVRLPNPAENHAATQTLNVSLRKPDTPTEPEVLPEEQTPSQTPPAAAQVEPPPVADASPPAPEPTGAPQEEVAPASGLFRYDQNESSGPNFAPRTNQESHGTIFHPGMRQALGEARAKPRGGPPDRSGNIKTYTSIAGQEVIKMGDDCFVLLPGASRLDGRSAAPVSCGGKNSSEKFADRVREALRKGPDHLRTDRLP